MLRQHLPDGFASVRPSTTIALAFAALLVVAGATTGGALWLGSDSRHERQYVGTLDGAVSRLKAQGVVVRLDLPRGVLLVNRGAWSALEPGQRATFSAGIALYRKVRGFPESVTVTDAATGAVLDNSLPDTSGASR